MCIQIEMIKKYVSATQWYANLNRAKKGDFYAFRKEKGGVVGSTQYKK